MTGEDIGHGRSTVLQSIGSDGGGNPVDRAARALADPTRRIALYHLIGEKIATVESLAERICARGTDTDREDVPADSIRAVKTSLRHNHLPRLADLGVVDFDPRAGHVRLADLPREFEQFVELARSVEASD